MEAICFGMPEPVENNMPTSTTICLDYFNEIVPCISTCQSGQHLASNEPVCDLLLRKWAVQQRCFEIQCASASHVAHAEAESLCQEVTENDECHIKYIEGYTIASNTLKCKAVDVKTAVGIWTGIVSCIPKLRGVPPSIANTLHTSVERYYLDFVAYNCKSGYSLNGLRYSKKEFFLRCKSDGTYDFPHLICEPINCTLEDALTARRIDLSDGSLASSSPVVLDPNEWLKYRCGEGRTLSGIPDSSDLFTMTCLDHDHIMTHCKSVQCGVPPVIAHATPLGGCFVTITYGEQVEYQCEADYHVGSERKSGSKPEGCHATERTESEQPVQATEEPAGAVSSCGHDASLEEKFASLIDQQDRPFPSHEWLEDWSRARCDEMSQWTVLITGPPGTGKMAGVRLLSGHVRGTFLVCDMREVEERKLAKLIMKGQEGLRQTSVAILNIDTDVTDEVKWRLGKAAQQLQIPLIFVSDDGVVNARDEFVQKCFCLEVRHDPQNAEQALRRMTQRNVPEVLICWSRTAKNSVEHSSVSTSHPVERAFETLDQCAFTAMIATLSAETSLPKGRFGQPLDRSQSRGAQDGGLLVTNSSPTELASKAVAQGDTDELDRTWKDQDERIRADERRTSNAENDVENELVRGDDHGKTRLEASTNEEYGWTLAEEHKNIQDDVTFAEGAWNENAAEFEQKYLLDGVLALDANDAATSDKVMKEAETAIVEGEAVDLPEVYDDRKDEATLCDVMTEEVLVPAKGAPQTGWHVDRFPQGPGRMRLVRTPLWSLRPPTCVFPSLREVFSYLFYFPCLRILC